MKSERTKALMITKETKMLVWERDNRQCIFCGKYVDWNFANSHFIKRSHGGLGIPENIMTNCYECHHLFDDTPMRKYMIQRAEDYFKQKYPNWNKDNLVYKKYSTYNCTKEL